MNLRREIVREHEWFDTEGVLQFVHVKYADGSWGYRHPTTVGASCAEHPDAKPFETVGASWCPKKPAIARLLMWRMADLEAALGEGKDVWWCAGEKDANNLAPVVDGAVTAVHQGEGKGGATAEQFGLFAGTASVVRIVLDRDRTGYKDALQRYDGLRELGLSEKQLRILGSAETKLNDVSDHLAAGNAVSELKQVSVKKLRARVERESSSAQTLRTASAAPGLARMGRFTSALERAGSRRGSGQDWTCPHPDHSDERPSFGVKAEGSRLLLNCQACMPDRGAPEHKRWVREVLDALGLQWADIGNGDEEHSGRLRMYDPVELAEKPAPFEWLIKGVWSLGSPGPFAGAKKTLKTYCAMLFALAVASGKPAFGFAEWGVPTARPVLYLCAEGGINMVRRRLQRIASDIYGIAEISEIPLYTVSGAASLDSTAFSESIEGFCDEIRQTHGIYPGLLVVDPLYSYHPSNVEVSNLYQRGGMLTRLQHGVESWTGGQATLWVLDHFNKTGARTGPEALDTDRIGQSGMSQWADTWWIAAHRESPDLSENAFQLNVEVGSRQGYGFLYEVEITLGRFDSETNEYQGAMKCEVRRVSEHTWASGSRGGISGDKTDLAILQIIKDREWELTESQLAKEVGGNAGKVRDRIAALKDEQKIVVRKMARKRSDGQSRPYDLVGLGEGPRIRVPSSTSGTRTDYVGEPE